MLLIHKIQLCQACNLSRMELGRQVTAKYEHVLKYVVFGRAYDYYRFLQESDCLEIRPSWITFVRHFFLIIFPVLKKVFFFADIMLRTLFQCWDTEDWHRNVSPFFCTQVDTWYLNKTKTSAIMNPQVGTRPARNRNVCNYVCRYLHSSMQMTLSKSMAKCD